MQVHPHEKTQRKDFIHHTPQLMIFFFFYWNINWNIIAKRKGSRTKQKEKKLNTVQSQVESAWITCCTIGGQTPFPDLRNFILPCILRKLVDNVLHNR